jgi:hypothetical protein
VLEGGGNCCVCVVWAFLLIISVLQTVILASSGDRENFRFLISF